MTNFIMLENVLTIPFSSKWSSFHSKCEKNINLKIRNSHVADLYSKPFNFQKKMSSKLAKSSQSEL